MHSATSFAREYLRTVALLGIRFTAAMTAGLHSEKCIYTVGAVDLMTVVRNTSFLLSVLPAFTR
jgi:hypothetical protein